MYSVDVSLPRMNEHLLSMTRITLTVDVLTSHATDVAKELMDTAQDILTSAVKEPF